jgi:Ser/Thr protein kinase RdoA (MazF antagonist)
MSYMVLLRSIIPKVVNLSCAGPSFLQFTDLHASNIFVDADWNITGIIDLEFIC